MEPTNITVEPFRPDMLDGRYLGVVSLDPAGARHLLGMNLKNRKVRNNRVEQYSDAITEGRWQLSPDAIAIDDGQLVNGQHRCRAIVSAGQAVPIVLLANFGTAFDVTDNGASRSASDVLFLAGLSEYPGALATASKLYLRECGYTPSALSDNRFIERWVIDHAELETWTAHYEQLVRSTRNPIGSLFASAMTVLSFAVEAGDYAAIIPTRQGGAHLPQRVATDRDTLMAFGYELVTGLGINDVDDPVNVVRNQIGNLIEKRTTSTSLKSPMFLDVVTKAWHARIQGKKPSRFKFGSVGEWPYATTKP